MAVCIVLLATCSFVVADTIVLKSSVTYKGELLKRTSRTVTFRVVFDNGAEVTLNFPADQVKSVTKGDAPVPRKPAKPTPPPEPKVKPPRPGGARPAKKSESAINAMIQKVGKELPDWWDSVKLDYPRTLDLSGANRMPGWRPKINIGAYFYSIVTPHPKRWKPGIKLLHHVIDVRKNNPMRKSEAIAMLSNYYMRYLEDYPRAAYWNLENTRMGGRPTLHGVVGLAECYWLMGNKQMAVSLLTRYGLDNRPSSPGAKLWSEMGYNDRALKLATSLASMVPDVGYLTVANLHRRNGAYAQAVEYYSKAAATRNMRGHGKLNRQRARECLEAVRLCKTLDVSKVSDGTHRGVSASYRGPLAVEVKVAGGRITSVKVAKHTDDIFFTSLTRIPERIVAGQSVERLDAVSGATVTCEAIVNAATKALSSGMR